MHIHRARDFLPQPCNVVPIVIIDQLQNVSILNSNGYGNQARCKGINEIYYDEVVEWKCPIGLALFHAEGEKGDS